MGSFSAYVKTDWRLKDVHVDAGQVGVTVWKSRKICKCYLEKVPSVPIETFVLAGYADF